MSVYHRLSLSDEDDLLRNSAGISRNVELSFKWLDCKPTCVIWCFPLTSSHWLQKGAKNPRFQTIIVYSKLIPDKCEWNRVYVSAVVLQTRQFVHSQIHIYVGGDPKFNYISYISTSAMTQPPKCNQNQASSSSLGPRTHRLSVGLFHVVSALSVMESSVNNNNNYNNSVS